MVTAKLKARANLPKRMRTHKPKENPDIFPNYIMGKWLEMAYP